MDDVPFILIHLIFIQLLYHLSVSVFQNSCKQLPWQVNPQKVDSQGRRRIFKRNLGVGFGNLTATAENLRPGAEESKLPEAAEIIIKAASNCCSIMCNQCCCMCCVQCCSKINNQFAIVLTQLCTALACFGCIECCSEICCGGQDGH